MSKTFTLNGPDTYDNKKLLSYFSVTITSTEEEIVDPEPDDNTNTITFKYNLSGEKTGSGTVGSLKLTDGIVTQAISVQSSGSVCLFPYNATSVSLTSLSDFSTTYGNLSINTTKQVAGNVLLITMLLNKAANNTSTLLEPEYTNSLGYYISCDDGYTYSILCSQNTSLENVIKNSSDDFNSNPTYIFNDIVVSETAVAQDISFEGSYFSNGCLLNAASNPAYAILGSSSTYKSLSYPVYVRIEIYKKNLTDMIACNYITGSNAFGDKTGIIVQLSTYKEKCTMTFDTTTKWYTPTGQDYTGSTSTVIFSSAGLYNNLVLIKGYVETIK